jgi:hypothetical protein
MGPDAPRVQLVSISLVFCGFNIIILTPSFRQASPLLHRVTQTHQGVHSSRITNQHSVYAV